MIIKEDDYQMNDNTIIKEGSDQTNALTLLEFAPVYQLEGLETKYFYEGFPVPRVTHILSDTIHEEYLMKWANSLGFKHKSYETERDSAANKGTLVHEAIEDYLKNGVESNLPGFLAFKKWWDMINSTNQVEVVASELSMACPWFGGTCDLIIKVNGVTFIVDFKTSNNIGYKHFLQLAAYGHLYRFTTGDFGAVNGGYIILQLDKEVPEFTEYAMILNKDEHNIFMANCLETFLSLTYAYHQLYNTKRDIKQFI